MSEAWNQDNWKANQRAREEREARVAEELEIPPPLMDELRLYAAGAGITVEEAVVKLLQMAQVEGRGRRDPGGHFFQDGRCIRCGHLISDDPKACTITKPQHGRGWGQ